MFASALESGAVDAAVLWDPDLALAVKNSGAHVIYSTRVATNLIYDVIVCDTRILDEGRTAPRSRASSRPGWRVSPRPRRIREGAVDAL